MDINFVLGMVYHNNLGGLIYLIFKIAQLPGETSERQMPHDLLRILLE